MKKQIIALLIFTTLFIGVSKSLVVKAEDPPTIIPECSPEMITYERASKIWELDIRRTVDNFVTSIVVKLFSEVYGTNPDRVKACTVEIRSKINEIFPDYNVQAFGQECPSPEEGVCDKLMGDFSSGAAGASADSVVARGVDSSLIGFTNLVDQTVRKEPLPVNLAYAWNQTIDKVPFANKALAATDPAENLPIVQAAYSTWEFFRDISLAIISIVLLYTGIMIVMRKKVNPQLVVSVQYAIPRILVGLLLIIFSYAIGALIAAVSWGLFRGGFRLVMTESLFKGGTYAEFPSGLLTLAITVLLLDLAQGGVFYITMILLTGIVLAILYLVVLFKALLIYLKMVFSIISAPLEFAIGTVPGSEGRIMDWFKRMAKYGLSVFAMGILIPITLMISLNVLVAYSSPAAKLGGAGVNMEFGGFGTVLSIIAPIIIVMFGFSVALSIEKKIDAMFFGGGKRK